MSARSSLFRRVAPASLAGVLVLAACSGGGSAKTASKSTTTTTPKARAIGIELGEVKVVSAGPKDATLPDDARDKVVATMQRYVTDGVVTPLATGKKSGDLSAAFDKETLARVNGPDRATLLDEGMPKADRVIAKTAAVALTALADQGGATVLVSAGLVLDLDATINGKPVHIKRLGDFVLASDGDSWKISAYDVGVQRDGAGLPPDATSSTAVSKP